LKPVAFVLFAVVLAAIQSAVLRWVGGGAFSVSLLACVVVYLGLHGGNVDGSVGAAGVGYVLDLLCGSPKGLMTFLSVLVFVLVRAVQAAVDVRGRGPFASLSAGAAFGLSLGAMILTRYTTSPEAAPGAALVPRMIVEALLTAALSPLVLAGLKRVDGLFRREEPGLLR
jgi:cell shape-determining protein MreD